MAFGAAIADPSLVWDAMRRRGVEAAEAALVVVDAYKRITGELPDLSEET